MIYKKTTVGHLNDKDIIAYNISYDNGFEVEILNLGGIITKIITPDKDNNLENIVVGYKNINGYIENPSYMGAIIGRTSGRIYNGKISIDNKEYRLSKNYGINQGHGGNVGFNKKIYDVNYIKSEDEFKLILSCKSKDLEENYPGNLDVEVTFEISRNFKIKQIYKAISDKKTLVNMTNHSYFNLSGNLKKPVTNQYMQINSDFILELDATSVPTGNYIDVNNTPFDFRKLKSIGRDIDKSHNQINIGCGYDHPFILNNGKIHLEDKTSKRAMDIKTNQECVVVYSMNFTDDLVLYNNKTNQRRFGICFETQAPPIGENMCFLERSILEKDSEYTQITEYKFYITE
ncbi:aldose epimerase family protein [Paraclostridium sordellii]|uniref:aldose epimerase family protein n=1 Tax=Paraclostridium sordellii TaxID=1505 RepID=UPI0005DDBD85|nr:aldose epimerase family protein [Paeniclostridium sordellii]CEN25491.1 aldose 1-epimerase [[Clostridium] sordellii] [Paeniclostridium sordellii]